ncbi:MAG: beta-ketoacyl-[acyl-carrier-protein] synthase II, partial [Planctomycetes bacterium]|nr:beta-ketoacyl-[acyl-carrier-protein] synthase II [Planctomycetota bacterium]
MPRRVAITGMGVVSPLGGSLDELSSNLLDGVSGAGPITAFDRASLRTGIAGVVEVKALAEHSMDRKFAFATVAAR